MRGLSILVIILVTFILLLILGWSRVPDMLANNLSKKLGVSVSIDSMKLRPTKIDINEFEIGNPKPYSLPKAFSAKEIDLQAPITEYFKKHLVVEQIEVKDIYLGIEFDSTSGTDGNWTRIMSNYQKNTTVEKSGKEEPSVLIKKIIFKNIQTELLFRDKGSIQKLPNIDQIELTNISTEGGFPTDQIMGSILGQMLKQVFIKQHMGNLLKGILDTPQNAVDTFLKPFKGFFNTAPKQEITLKKTA